jgi:NAD(P)-dependent dehydrogenase (short-subunit alcohol dehydrogenase family)
MPKQSSDKERINPPQKQSRPGSERAMHPKPQSDKPIPSSGKLADKVALITGGDSGIGKAVAILFAKEGADIAIIYLNEHRDARNTARQINAYGRRCLLIPGDISKEDFCKKAIHEVVRYYKKIDVLVNNAAMHYETPKLSKVSTPHLFRTFETNVFSMFWITKYALPHLHKGASIINTSSVTAYRGSPKLLDYSASKGAIVSFTRSLSSNLVKKGIRVNGVAPGPIWTPLIPASFKSKKVAEHGSEAPMERAGQPAEVAPCFLFLASGDSSYISGQFLHPNGGEIING